MKSFFLMMCLALAPLAAKAEMGVTKMAVSGPLMVIHGDAYFGANFSAYHGVTEDFDLGGETGFFYHSGSGFSSWVIPVIPTGLYHFDIGNPTFKPFAGLGLGIGITHTKVDLGTNLSASGSSTNFMGLIHLGAAMGATQQFFGDIKLGLLDGDFVFMPTVGWFF
ncbi:MAG: hypothetical protein ACXVBE_05350 [Bdellovibrionota bacterium]